MALAFYSFDSMNSSFVLQIFRKRWWKVGRTEGTRAHAWDFDDSGVGGGRKFVIASVWNWTLVAYLWNQMKNEGTRKENQSCIDSVFRKVGVVVKYARGFVLDEIYADAYALIYLYSQF